MAQGIIEKTRKKRRGNKFVERPDTDKRQNPKILDLQLLRETVENVCSHHLTDAPKSEWKSNRRWSYVSEFHLAGVLGHVDMPTWVFMIEQNIEWTREMRETVQPNGKWELCAFEQRLERRDNVTRRTVGRPSDADSGVVEIAEEIQYLVLGLEFVDLNGNQDLRYDMGRVTREADRPNQLTPEMIAKLMASNAPTATPAPAVDDTLIKEQEEKISTQQVQIDELSAKLSQMTELMAGLAEQMQSNNTAPEEQPAPTVKRRKRK